jgi:His-Xaa-Ser system protein HxsD
METPFSRVLQDDVSILRLQEAIYSRDAVLRTCYWFTDRCFLFINRPSAGILEVHLSPKHAKPTLAVPSPEKLDDLTGDFLNALLDHQLRQDIESQTGKIRELLVAKAFAEAGLEDAPPGDPFDPVDAATENLVVRIRHTDSTS